MICYFGQTMHSLRVDECVCVFANCSKDGHQPLKSILFIVHRTAMVMMMLIGWNSVAELSPGTRDTLSPTDQFQY